LVCRAQAISSAQPHPPHTTPDDNPTHPAPQVFTRLTAAYLKSAYGTDWQCKAPIKLCERAFAGTCAAEGQEVVVLARVMADAANLGYQELSNVQVGGWA
jgi:hypothetical protein